MLSVVVCWVINESEDFFFLLNVTLEEYNKLVQWHKKYVGCSDESASDGIYDYFFDDKGAYKFEKIEGPITGTIDCVLIMGEL